MSEELRALLYPLGLFSALAFTLRFIVQWLQSEKAKRSLVTASFWRLSMLGNLTLGLHALIQGQFPILLVQALNSVISWRNLNLMQEPSQQWSLSSTIQFLCLSTLLSALLFWFITPDGDWFRIPLHPLQNLSTSLSWLWHLFGTLGIVLFASRFWIQWIQAELAQKSTLESSFWWLSIIGALFSILYFALMRDYVNLVGPLFGLIPYCRNLALLRKANSSYFLKRRE